jgi:hypothetical protein
MSTTELPELTAADEALGRLLRVEGESRRQRDADLQAKCEENERRRQHYEEGRLVVWKRLCSAARADLGPDLSEFADWSMPPDERVFDSEGKASREPFVLNQTSYPIDIDVPGRTTIRASYRRADSKATSWMRESFHNYEQQRLWLVQKENAHHWEYAETLGEALLLASNFHDLRLEKERQDQEYAAKVEAQERASEERYRQRTVERVARETSGDRLLTALRQWVREECPAAANEE